MPARNLTAGKIVNTYSEEKLTQILKNYGEEPKARQIAKRIINNRPLRTTDQLAEIAAKPGPATVGFILPPELSKHSVLP
jgi:16S rRNA (cytosine1402-N4)-methyltransferase